jgi:hypothetical protein
MPVGRGARLRVITPLEFIGILANVPRPYSRKVQLARKTNGARSSNIAGTMHQLNARLVVVLTALAAVLAIAAHLAGKW